MQLPVFFFCTEVNQISRILKFILCSQVTNKNLHRYSNIYIYVFLFFIIIDLSKEKDFNLLRMTSITKIGFLLLTIILALFKVMKLTSYEEIWYMYLQALIKNMTGDYFIASIEQRDIQWAAFVSPLQIINNYKPCSRLVEFSIGINRRRQFAFINCLLLRQAAGLRRSRSSANFPTRIHPTSTTLLSCSALNYEYLTLWSTA